MNAAHDSALRASLEASTPMEAVPEIEGATISGADSHQLTIAVPKYKYRAAPIGTQPDPAGIPDVDRVVDQVVASQ